MLPSQDIKESALSPPHPPPSLTMVFGPPPTRRQQVHDRAPDRAWTVQTAYQAERTGQLSEALLSKALRDIRSGCLEVSRAALLYGIPQDTLRIQLEAEGPLQGEEVTSQAVGLSMRGGEARLVLQRLAAWAELGTRGADGGMLLLQSSTSRLTHSSALPTTLSLPKLREELHLLPTLSPPSPTPLRIPQIRSSSTPCRPAPPTLYDPYSMADALFRLPPPHDGATTNAAARAVISSSLPRLRGALLPSLDLPNLSTPHPALHHSSSLDDPEEGAEPGRENKQPRKKRGRYRQYNHNLLEEAIAMVMGGEMSVSKAQVVYGIPHSTLEYKVKERSGILKVQCKKASYGQLQRQPH